MSNGTTVTLNGGREVVVTRRFDATLQSVFDAWTKPELLKQWWAPKSLGMKLQDCETDIRAGGSYRFTFGGGGHPPMVFHGRYVEAAPPHRLVWTNEESDQGAVTTLTLTEDGGQTLLHLSEVYPTTEGVNEALAGMEGGAPEQYRQLDELLARM